MAATAGDSPSGGTHQAFEDLNSASHDPIERTPLTPLKDDYT